MSHFNRQEKFFVTLKVDLPTGLVHQLWKNKKITINMFLIKFLNIYLIENIDFYEPNPQIKKKSTK